MNKKLATVILPTHSDPGTLKYAISSVLNQTETKLELIIVLDGATPRTKTTAHEWARADARVRVLDLPKGSGRGGENRHIAILSAESEVIFYIDEDDLWLPNHVSLLLNKIYRYEADVVCSTVASVRPDNGIEVAPFSHASGQLREALRAGAWRALFKIHMCHTKKSYEQLPNGWLHRADDEVVKSLLVELSDKRFNWVATHEVTALSFHGTPRRDAGISSKSRSLQIYNYSRKIKRGRIQSHKIISKASIVHYFVSVVFFIDPIGANLEEYVEIIGKPNKFESPIDKKFMDKSSETINFPFTKLQREVATSILDYRSGKKISTKNAWRICRSLTKVVCGPPIWSRRQGVKFLISSTVGM